MLMARSLRPLPVLVLVLLLLLLLGLLGLLGLFGLIGLFGLFGLFGLLGLLPLPRGLRPWSCGRDTSPLGPGSDAGLLLEDNGTKVWFRYSQDDEHA